MSLRSARLSTPSCLETERGSGAACTEQTVSGDGETTGDEQSLAALLRRTAPAFLRVLASEQKSSEYVQQADNMIHEYADFCHAQGTAHPWQLRQEYLTYRARLRSGQAYSDSYLRNVGRLCGYFLRWYQRRVACGKVGWGELSDATLRAYGRTRRGAPAYRRRLLAGHRELLMRWLQSRPYESNVKLEVLVHEYLEYRRQATRAQGYGLVLTHRAQMVTRGHLLWLEQHGLLPPGSAGYGASLQAVRCPMTPSERLLERLERRVGTALPETVRHSLLDYMKHLADQQECAPDTLQASLRVNLALCRYLAQTGHTNFSRLGVRELDHVVQALLTAPVSDTLRRRQQVQAQHSKLRGFLRYLYRRGLSRRDLADLLISPPCYRSNLPKPVLSPKEVSTLLGSVDRKTAVGRRAYLILQLITTYGLRSVDIARLSLDELRWRQQEIALVQNKTGRTLTLPLMPAVADALLDYLQQDRLARLPHRHVLVSVPWPHRPLRAQAIATIVTETATAAGLSWVSARHLRSTVATHLLRQGVAFGTIAEVLGHRHLESTERYASVDVEMLRQVLEESER